MTRFPTFLLRHSSQRWCRMQSGCKPCIPICVHCVSVCRRVLIAAGWCFIKQRWGQRRECQRGWCPSLLVKPLSVGLLLLFLLLPASIHPFNQCSSPPHFLLSFFIHFFSHSLNPDHSFSVSVIVLLYKQLTHIADMCFLCMYSSRSLHFCTAQPCRLTQPQCFFPAVSLYSFFLTLVLPLPRLPRGKLISWLEQTRLHALLLASHFLLLHLPVFEIL